MAGDGYGRGDVEHHLEVLGIVDDVADDVSRARHGGDVHPRLLEMVDHGPGPKVAVRKDLFVRVPLLRGVQRVAEGEIGAVHAQRLPDARPEEVAQPHTCNRFQGVRNGGEHQVAVLKRRPDLGGQREVAEAADGFAGARGGDGGVVVAGEAAAVREGVFEADVARVVVVRHDEVIADQGRERGVPFDRVRRESGVVDEHGCRGGREGLGRRSGVVECLGCGLDVGELSVSVSLERRLG